ncbi:hypothetical protein BKA58DRAFT_188694 [Alternaria rosae]|uniref:uncharacterized protein n=1 Tax=Alternaria rosae TaxID=1187941 RepID=UPI001E8D4E96|nr:uncharacterized protein BKA58DRAFT_188694 [Alternaria rosae]KAH6868115.1 hypothetical protein BKA58DRAFT_188694 [Alternaria rosae]
MTLQHLEQTTTTTIRTLGKSLFFLISRRYASYLHAETPGKGCTVPCHQPIVDHNNAFLPQQAAQTNGRLSHAQAEDDSGPQYPCQINPWNEPAFDAYYPGGFNPDTAFYGASSNFPYHGIVMQSALPVAPVALVWDFNGIQEFHQSTISLADAAQLNPASYPAPVSALPATVPTPAAADRFRCPHGCPATFGRGGEYRRHMMIHERPRYRCPIVDCPKAFSRADKLRDHAKRGHGGRNPLNL